MTIEEREVIDRLVDAHNLYSKLPTQHPADHAEWTTKMHDLQRIVMAREMVDNNPDFFYNEQKTK